MSQSFILAITLIGMTLTALPFVITAQATDSSVQPTRWLSESGRRAFFAALLVLGIIVMPLSLWAWPHRVTSSSTYQTVNATGHQWYWEIDVKGVIAGSPVIFNVHSADVNHGFGVYDSDDRLLFQVQGMPGYVNRVQYTFETPGTYRVLCLEFCGIFHHEMNETLLVTARNQGKR
jgi:cytochrome c oxidase subunit 2